MTGMEADVVISSTTGSSSTSTGSADTRETASRISVLTLFLSRISRSIQMCTIEMFSIENDVYRSMPSTSFSSSSISFVTLSSTSSGEAPG